LIDNPDYHPDSNLYAYDSFKYIGIDVWQVKSGSIFDNIIITSDVEEADKWVKDWEVQKEGEKKAFDAHKEEEREKAEEERKAREAEEASKKEESTEDAEEASEESKDEL